MIVSRHLWDDFYEMPVMGIVRNIGEPQLGYILEAYARSGLKTIEISMNSPRAPMLIKQAVRLFGHDLRIGAGTVLRKEDLAAATNAGASFIVTPVTDEHIITAAVKNGLPCFPGAFTATEVYKAWTLGAAMVKIFPVTTVDPRYVKDLKAPLQQVQMMAVGGVHTGNCIAWLQAGADAVGMGSTLFDRDMIDAMNWTALTTHFTNLVHKIRHWQHQMIIKS